MSSVKPHTELEAVIPKAIASLACIAVIRIEPDARDGERARGFRAGEAALPATGNHVAKLAHSIEGERFIGDAHKFGSYGESSFSGQS